MCCRNCAETSCAPRSSKCSYWVNSSLGDENIRENEFKCRHRNTKHSRFRRSDQNIEVSRDSVAVIPQMSVPRRSQQLGSLQKILTKDLHVQANKIQLTQQLQSMDQHAVETFRLIVIGQTTYRRQFCKGNNLLWWDTFSFIEVS